jgi:acetylornithine deacetylase/succinyl-diaminopimelate desuccinylase-like protein
VEHGVCGIAEDACPSLCHCLPELACDRATAEPAEAASRVAEGRLNIVSNPGTSPNYCSVEFDLWFLPGESFEAIRGEVESFVQAASQTDPWLREHPPRFTWKLRDIFFPPPETFADHPFIQSLVASLEQAGQEPRTQASTAASELAWYAELGISATLFGPGRIAQAHSPDE